MVVGFCQGAYGSDQSVVAHVCVVRDRLAGDDQPGLPSFAIAVARRSGLTAPRGLTSSSPLRAGSGKCHGPPASTGPNSLGEAVSSRQAQIRSEFSKCVLTSALLGMPGNEGRSLWP